MEKLKPCPFCGTEDISVNRMYINPILGVDSIPDEVNVSCSACGIGYTEETEEEAVKNWNNRESENPIW